MAKIDRFRSPEEIERLAELKRGINLPALATERYGFTITERGRDGENFVLRNEQEGARITMKTGPEGWHIYNNHNDDRDKGSVVDFLQKRHPEMNLGQVKGMMQELVPGARQALDQERFNALQVQRGPSASEERYQSLPPSERRQAMVRDTTGPKLELTDSSYLQERGLSKETINDPAFAGRIFTDKHPERQERDGKPQHNVGFPYYNEKGIQSWELRNRAPEGETDTFKMQMKAPGDEFGAKNGVWSSNLLQGRGSQPERMVIGESPIDMMSKYQTERAEKGDALENSRYVATGGTPSIEQKAIIQAIIDREQPKTVVLSNDNDPAGQAFNVRYLNDLRPPVAALDPDVQRQAAAASERLSWIAGDNGKKGDEKLLTMTITMRTEVFAVVGTENGAGDTLGGAREGRRLVEALREKAESRGLRAEEPEVTNGVGLQMRRNAPEQTEVVLRVPPAQAAELVDFARELRRDREASLPQEARTPENYFVVEKANGKDYNQDILQARSEAQFAAARQAAGFTAAPEVAAAVSPAPEKEIAVVRVLDSEPLPQGVQAPDNRFRSLADEVRTALEATGVEVKATPLPSFDRGPIVSTELEFDYTRGTAQAEAAQQVLANAQANSSNRVSIAGIEPAAEPQGDSRFHIGLPLAYAPVGVAAEEGNPVLEARLRAAELTVIPTQVDNEPGFVVLLDRGNAREAAALEQVITLHERESQRPLVLLQSEETAQVRQAGVEAYYSPELGNNATPPALSAQVIVADDQKLDAAQERLTNVGATVTPLPAVEGEEAALRVSYPLDKPEVTANVSRLLDETTITNEASYDREARHQLTANQGEPRIDIEFLGRPEVNAAIVAEETQRSADRVAAVEPPLSGEERRARVEDELQASVLGAEPTQPTISRVVQDPELDYTKLGYPGSATVAVGYPGNEPAFQQMLEEAGATRIERPVSEYAPAGTTSYSYPLDQPAVVAKVSDVLDDIEMIAESRKMRLGAEALAQEGPLGIYELPAYQHTRQLAYLSVEGQTATPQISADINLNGSTSQDEILRADSNRDGVVTGTELDTARFEINQAKERQQADEATLAESGRQAALRRQEQERQASEESETQRTSTARAAELAQSEQRAVDTVIRQAGLVIFDAEPLPSGTLAADSTTAQPYSHQVKAAIEATGAEVNSREYRDPSTGQPATMLSFAYGENTPQHHQIQETVRDVMEQPNSKVFGITAAAGEAERETPRLERAVAAHEQPLAIALDAPNPLLESQLRATGAVVTPEAVQDRPGLVVVLDTNKGEQLAGVEAALTKLPASAVVIESPEAAEMRQSLTQTFREQGGAAPRLQAEAFINDSRQSGVAEQLREAGATVSPVVAPAREDVPAGSLAVRYPLDQVEVVGRVSVVLDTVNARSAQLALSLGEAPGATTGSVVETPLAQQTRQAIAREQGLEPAPQRELPPAQEPVDRPLARPVSTVIPESTQESGVGAKAEATAAPAPAESAAKISLEAAPHPVERRIVLDIREEKPALAPTLEGYLTTGGFKVATAPLEAAGEEKSGTRIEATYRTTDPKTVREQQGEVLKNIGNMKQDALTVHEPDGQAQERAEALKAPKPIMGKDNKPDPSKLLAAGQMLVADISILEVSPDKSRAEQIWKDVKSAGGRVDNIRPVDMEEGGMKYSFQVKANPGDARLPALSAVLEGANRSEGIQVQETDNMRLERLARSGAREAKSLAEMKPEQRENYVAPVREYPASRPDAYQHIALTDDSLKTPAGVKALRAELRETGADVAIQHPDGRPAGSGTVQLSYLAAHPKVEAVEDVLRDFAGKGGHVYDVKAGADFEAGKPLTAAQVLANAPTAAQEHEANQAEIRSLEARRDALRESQREANVESLRAEQKIQTPEVAAVAAGKEGGKAWVGFGPDLRGEDLSNTDATGMDLRGANLAGQDLRTTDLQNSDLRGANLAGVDLRGANLTGVRLEGAEMEGAQLEKSFRVIDNLETGRRQIEDNLTAEKLTAPERTPGGYEAQQEPATPQVAQPERLAVAEEPARELATAAAEASVAAPQVAVLEAPQPAGLSLPTEEELRLTQPVVQLPQEVAAPTPELVPAAVAEAPSVAAEVQPTPALSGEESAQQPAPAQVPAQPVESQVLVATAEAPALSLPTAEQLSLFPSAGPVQELPALAPPSEEPARQQATAEAVGLEVPGGPKAAPGSLSRYEELEEAGTALHVVTIHVTQPVWTEESGVAVADMPDRVKEVQDRLAATGAEVTLDHGTTVDEVAKTETSVLSLVYAHDDKELPALHKALNEVVEVPAGSDYGVRVEDANAAERSATVESRLENTPEAAKALAQELHDGDPTTARLLIQRPALEDVWALEEAGAKVERIYLPDGPAAQVSYPANEPGVTSVISIELDRIERDSTLTRPPHNSHERELSGGLLGEDPAQQERRQAMAEAEGLKLAPQARYELHEMAERDARATTYFVDESRHPSDQMEGKLANGEKWQGGYDDVFKIGSMADRDALLESWKQEKTTLLLVVQETPELRLAEDQPAAAYPERVAAALREAGAEAQVKGLGISPDTGLDKHIVAVTFENSSPELDRIQATLGRLAHENGVQVPAEGYWQREMVLGPNGSMMAEPVLAERDRPWLEAVVAVQEPTQQERRELTRAGARIEDTTLEGNENKPAILVYYDLDNPITVARVSPTLDRAEADGRLLGEAGESRDARAGRVEQYQNDIRIEKEQTAEVWGKHAQQFPPAEKKFETEPTENAVPMSFTDRLRAAVNERLEEFRKGYEMASPENIALYKEHQRGVADRENGPKKEAQEAAYQLGLKGPEAAKEATPAEAEKTVGGVTAGTAGTNAEVTSEKVLRERRDDERTIPVVLNGPAEGKVLETTEQVKPGIAATPEKGPDAKPATPAEAEKAVATPSAAEVTPVTPAAVVAAKAQEHEWQHGIIGMEASTKRTAEERMELVRGALLTSGATVGNVVRSNEDNKAATLTYSFDPQSPDLEKINKVLTDVHTAKPSMIQEEPHSMHQAGIKPHSHEIPREHWPEREGQFNKAHIVVDDFDSTGKGRAENIKGDLAKEGAIVSEVKKDGHGHVEMDVTYHTHSPNIDKINNTLEGAANSNGIEVQETSTDRSARYQGAIDLQQNKSQDKEREQGD